MPIGGVVGGEGNGGTSAISATPGERDGRGGRGDFDLTLPKTCAILHPSLTRGPAMKTKTVLGIVWIVLVLVAGIIWDPWDVVP